MVPKHLHTNAPAAPCPSRRDRNHAVRSACPHLLKFWGYCTEVEEFARHLFQQASALGPANFGFENVSKVPVFKVPPTKFSLPQPCILS